MPGVGLVHVDIQRFKVKMFYIAVYSLVDSYNIVYLGALKGAGDTLFVMLILAETGILMLIAPILTLKALDMTTLHALWVVLTAYVMTMALCSFLRFRHGGWRSMRVVEV
jgi:MATE family multidrug resistance protein